MSDISDFSKDKKVTFTLENIILKNEDIYKILQNKADKYDILESIIKVIPLFENNDKATRKDILLNGIRQYISDHYYGEHKQELLIFLDEYLPEIIKVLYDIDLKNININSEQSILDLAVKLIPLLEKYINTGSKKKEVLLMLLRTFARKSEHKDLLIKFIDNYLPFIIDTMISVAKKEIDLGKYKEFRCCFF